MALLEVDHLSFRVAGRSVLEDLMLSVQAGEIHALVGANGAGKSTLAYLIMGCEGYRPDLGRIGFDGKAIDKLPLHERARLGITLAWHEPARFEGLSVRGYLTLGAERSKASGEPVVDIEDCLRRVGLTPADYLTRNVDETLSGGERKRIELAIDYAVNADEHALVELTARVFGHGDDSIRIREKVVLAGKAARGLIKTRIAVEDEAGAEIIGITEGNAARARGHMDCLEIVKDRATASAQPVVRVSHPQAKVTHEAAIGSVDSHQMETLMAHGLSPEEAVDTIVCGLLGQRESDSRSTIQFRNEG